MMPSVPEFIVQSFINKQMLLFVQLYDITLWYNTYIKKKNSIIPTTLLEGVIASDIVSVVESKNSKFLYFDEPLTLMSLIYMFL